MSKTFSEHFFTPPLLALSALTFVIGICELVVVGILPEIAEGLGSSLTAMGRLVSVFSACYAVGTPVITMLAGRLPRYRAIFILLLMYWTANLLCMLAPNILMLCIARGLTAPISGSLTVMAILFARNTVEHRFAARAVAIVYACFSAAAITGVPLGTAICHALGWRWTFALIVILGAAVTPVLLHVLPREGGPQQVQKGLLHQLTVLRDRRMLLCILMILFSASATYTIYTYVSPIITGPLGLPKGAVSPVLLMMGVCCTVSNLWSGRLGERSGIRKMPAVFAAQAVLSAAFPLLLGNTASGLACLACLALFMYLVDTPAQTYALDLAEREYPAASGLCASFQPVSYNLGIAVGSFTGSVVQQTWGLRPLGVPAAVFALLALAGGATLIRRRQAGTKGPAAERPSC